MLDRNKIIEDIKSSQFDFYKSSNEIRELVLNDLEICYELLENHLSILMINFEELGQNIRDNKEFVLKYLTLNGYDFKLISDRLKSEIEVSLVAALSTNGYSLEYVDNSLYKNVLFLKLSFKTIKLELLNNPSGYFNIWEKIYKNSDLFSDRVIRLEILFKYHRLLKALILVLVVTSSLFFAIAFIFKLLYNPTEGDEFIFGFILSIGWIIPILLVPVLNYILFGYIPWKIISRMIKDKFYLKYGLW